MGYDILGDPDINIFETEDLKDLTKAGIGIAGREVVVNVEFAVFLLLMLTILGLLTVIWLKFFL